MKWFRKQTAPAGASVQLREAGHHPFGLLGQYVPMRSGEIRLYRAVREAVPVVDAAIYKLIRMVGGVTAACSDPAAERGLGEFLRTVPAGRGQYGVNAFLEGYLDALLTCGRAIGEIVPAAGNREIAAVLWGRVEDIEIREGDHPLAFTICGPDEQGRMGPLPCQDLLLFTPLNPEADSPYGVSLLRGLPFLTDILMKIYHTIGINWERCGSLRFAVTCRDGGNGQAEERSRMLAGEWSRAMQDTRSGSVRDFVAVGDVDIQVIGADAPVLDSEVPVRQILEQVVAKTGIPPFMLGLSWSSTERMSSQQADMLTTEITAIRRTITPVVERICRLWLRMHGYTCGFEVLWEDINLQDEVEDAIEVLRNGDGNQNAAQQYTIGTKPITGTKGTLTYDALLEFWSQFDPYTMNTMLVGSDVMLAMLKLDEFQNPLTGLNFQGTGTLTTPLGAKLLRTSAMPAGILIGLDRNYALEQICGSEITVEYDKLIDRQLERAAITSISGFAKLFTEASKVLVV